MAVLILVILCIFQCTMAGTVIGSEDVNFPFGFRILNPTFFDLCHVLIFLLELLSLSMLIFLFIDYLH